MHLLYFLRLWNRVCYKTNYFYLRRLLYISSIWNLNSIYSASSHPEVFLRKGALKICTKFTGEHPCRSAILIKLHSNFLKMAPRHGWYPVNLLHIFRALFLNNSYWRLLLFILTCLHKTWLNVLILVTRCWYLQTGTPKSFFWENQKQYEFGSQRFFNKNSVGTPILNLELFTWSNL